MGARSRAAVIGGGIGGLAAALALVRAGLDVEVFERQPAGEPAGTALSIAPNGMHALRRLGVGEEAESTGVNYRSLQVRDRRGRILSDTPAEDARSIRRADLLEILAKALPGGVLHKGLGCERVELAASGVELVLAGGERREADLVVGADGVHSTVGKVIDAPPAGPAGYTAYRAIVDGIPRGMPEAIALLTIGEGSTFGYFPLDGQQTYWYGTLSENRIRAARAASDLELLLAHYRDWHPPIRELIESTAESAILSHEILCRPALAAWGRGPATLLGDAAHPMSPALGQGACQALEDAVVLGDCLAEAGPTPGALRLYESRRISRSSRVAERSLRIGRLVHLEGPPRHFRDAFLRVAGRRVMNQRTWVVTHRV